MSPRRLVALVTIAASWGCGPRDTALHLVGVQPDAGHVLRLNEPIVWTFDRPVDRTSVNAHSIQIDAGRPVPGTFRVRGTRVEFVPAPATTAGPADAGWPAGGRVRVRFAGFPARDGVLASTSEPLAQAFVHEWPVTAATRGSEAFVDPDPNAPLTLLDGDGARTIAVAEHGWLRLRFSEPLDPTSVMPDAFPLEFGDAARTRVPLELRIDASVDGYAVELRPKDGFAPATARFVLECSALGVRDLLGGPCRASATLTLVPDAKAPEHALVGDDPGGAP